MAVRFRSFEEEQTIRDDVFRWLDRKQLTGQYEFSRTELVDYHFRGDRIPLLDTSRGIRNPADFRGTLSVMSGSKANRYQDEILDNGEVVYSLAAGDSPDNRKLRVAYEQELEIVYFKSDRPGYFVAYYPMRILHFDEIERHILMAEQLSSDLGTDPIELAVDQRRYGIRTSRARLHQRQFRATVLSAYTDHCAICRLRYPQLLDAAHITADSDIDGFATVENGLSLCKIHHRAYDTDLLGIDSDYRVTIHPKLLSDTDGPMLRHGLQDMHGLSIHIPEPKTQRPNRDRLHERFVTFMESSQ